MQRAHTAKHRGREQAGLKQASGRAEIGQPLGRAVLFPSTALLRAGWGPATGPPCLRPSRVHVQHGAPTGAAPTAHARRTLPGHLCLPSEPCRALHFGSTHASLHASLHSAGLAVFSILRQPEEEPHRWRLSFRGLVIGTQVTGRLWLTKVPPPLP